MPRHNLQGSLYLDYIYYVIIQHYRRKARVGPSLFNYHLIAHTLLQTYGILIMKI